MLEGREFRHLIDDLEHGKVRVDLLVVGSLSRLAREKKTGDLGAQVKSGQDWARIKAVLRARNVIVRDGSGDHDPNTVMFDLLTALNGEELKLIQYRTMGGKDRMHREGLYSKGGKPPFGYALERIDPKRSGHKVVEHSEQAADLRRILGWFVQGGETHAAREATKAGIPTSTGKAEWSHVSVDHLVHNAGSYASGEWPRMMRGQPVTAHYPKLIDGRLYSQVERRIREAKPSPVIPAISTGFVDCVCGAHVQIGTCSKSPQRYVRCRDACGSLREEVFTQALWDMTVARYVQIARQSKGRKQAADHYKDKIKDARSSVETVKGEMKKLMGLYTSGLIPNEEMYREAYEPLAQRHAAALAEVERLEIERDTMADRAAQRSSVEDNVRRILRAARGPMSLQDKRKALGDLLNGGRALVKYTSQDRGAARWAEITLPSWGSLPAVTARTDRPMDEQMLGVSRAALEAVYCADEHAVA
jgi:DNA invertase Pin-like site-specific DNA recombinase